jgi:hypothetical protein
MAMQVKKNSNQGKGHLFQCNLPVFLFGLVPFEWGTTVDV